MRSITQRHPFGCGVACVAFVVKKSYSEIVSILGDDKASNKGFYCRDLIKALSRFKYSYAYKYLKPKLRRSIYQDGVIVFIKRSLKYPSGHYLTYSNGLWMDPWINFVQNNNIKQAESGFRKRLPGTPIYTISPSN